MSDNKICQLNIGGMDCADCAVKVEKQVSKLTGVKQAQADFINAKLKVEFQESELKLDDIKKAIHDIGYSVKESRPVQKTTLIVAGMDCPDESRPIEDRLKKSDTRHWLFSKRVPASSENNAHRGRHGLP